MVLPSVLVSAPHTLTLSPPTGQLLLSQNFRVSALAGGEFKCVADGKTWSPKEFRLQSSQAFTNWRFEKCPQSFSSKNGSRADAAHTRIRCASTAASKKGVSVRFPVILEENTTVDSTAQAAVDQIKIDGPLALRVVAKKFEGLGNTETVELCMRFCNDSFIQTLNSKWSGKDSPTDVLSFPQDSAPGLAPHLSLGDVIISLDTAAKQAVASGHTLLDEVRILLVHGLLQHVLRYDHELGPDDSLAVAQKETQILAELGWKGKSQKSLSTAAHDGSPKVAQGVGVGEPAKKRSTKPPFKILFCDMDGTLLNEKARVTKGTADALKAVLASGVKIIIATGKTQYGAMQALAPVGLAVEGTVISEKSPGVFLQGLQVYGKGGQTIYSSCMDKSVVREFPDARADATRTVSGAYGVAHGKAVFDVAQAFQYSIDHNVQSVGFCQSRSVALSRSSLTDALHTVYVEREADIIPNLDDLMAVSNVQKFLFFDTPEQIKNKVRPYWVAKYKGKVKCVQALDDMLEMIPPGQSKGAGVTMLLDHLGVPPEEVMALGDGENDIEMLKLAGWGVAMANGAEETKSVANALTGSNEEDGAAQAIYKYILS